MQALALIAALAIVSLWLPLATAAPPAHHRPPDRVPLERFAVLDSTTRLAAFRHGLHERGYVEGTALHHREPLCGGGPPRASPASPPSWSASQVAVIVTAGSQAIQAVKQATSTIPVVMAASSDPALAHMMTAVHRYEGTVNQVMGDGIMALFGAPLAHEDHAARACYAALATQEALQRYAEEVRRTQGLLMQMRVGLNSGAGGRARYERLVHRRL